jgi:hypothetical protein
MLFWLQIAAAVTDLVAATFSFRSARKSPSDDLDGGARLQDFLNGAARLNRWAAGVTAESPRSPCCQAVAVLNALRQNFY